MIEMEVGERFTIWLAFRTHWQMVMEVESAEEVLAARVQDCLLRNCDDRAIFVSQDGLLRRQYAHWRKMVMAEKQARRMF